MQPVKKLGLDSRQDDLSLTKLCWQRQALAPLGYRSNDARHGYRSSACPSGRLRSLFL